MRLPACLLSLSLLLTACHDDVIPVIPPSDTSQPMASFVADPEGTAAGIRVRPVEVLGPDRVLFALETTWPADRLKEAYLLLRVDPGARPEIGVRPGDWFCDPEANWYPTNTPGEWLLQRSPGANDCACPLPEGQEPGFFDLAQVEVWFREPGTWRVELSPASPTPVCDCAQCLDPHMGFYGGTVHVAAP
jgi:hypothetical protein